MKSFSSLSALLVLLLVLAFLPSCSDDPAPAEDTTEETAPSEDAPAEKADEAKPDEEAAIGDENDPAPEDE